MTTIFKQRRNQFMQTLESIGVQQVLLLDPANIFYYTGFLSEPHERFMGLYINSDKQKEVLFVPALDQTAAEEKSDIPTIIPIRDEDNSYAIFKNTVHDIAGSLGIEGSVLKYNQSRYLTQLFSNAQLVDIEQTAINQRIRKSPEEIESIKEAIRLIELVLERGIQKITPGMTENDLTAELEYIMRKVGADGPSFSTIVLTGKNAALPHGVPGNTKINDGDLLLIDFGVIKNGYCSDITRTFAIGDVPAFHKELYDIVLSANQAGIDATSAGVPLKTIDITARDVIKNAGFGDYYHNRVGHGMGIEVHEAPSVHGGNDDLTSTGMVFTIEPGIYLPREIGIRIEDDIYINEQGECEVLTTFPKDLKIL